MPFKRSGSGEKQVDKSVRPLSERMFGSQATAEVTSAAIARHCQIIIRTSHHHGTRNTGQQAQQGRFCLHRPALVSAPAPLSRGIASSTYAHDRGRPKKTSHTNQNSNPANPSSHIQAARSSTHIIAGSKSFVILNAGDAVYVIVATTCERANAVIAKGGFRQLGIVYEGAPLSEPTDSTLSQQIHLEARVTSPDVVIAIMDLFERGGFSDDFNGDSSEVLETIYEPDPMYN